jgi:hypothetical protein
MKQTRSLSQVVFRFLPEQTVDLAGAIWRVDKWVAPRTLQVDVDVVRSELLRAIYRYTATGRDGGLADRLLHHDPIHVITPNDEDGTGVSVVPFPENYRCTHCGRIEIGKGKSCRCGTNSWRQLQFVAYHQCGKLDTPWIPQCKKHKQVRVDYPGTTRTEDLHFECPVCRTEVQRGFPFLRCECKRGTLSYNVHRAAVVYTPHSAVIVNPPSQNVALTFKSDAAVRQTFAWVLRGMVEEDPLAGRATVDSLVAELVAKNIAEDTARKMAELAANEQPGTVSSEDPLKGVDLGASEWHEAEAAALRIAYATAGGRQRVEDLAIGAPPEARVRYEQLYPRAVRRARLEAVELLDDFPVLNAVYGYTRGGESADSVLRPFPSSGGAISVHGQLAHTEGLLFRLDPVQVGRWLHARGLLPALPATPSDVRLAVLGAAQIPRPGEELGAPTFGSSVLTLVHSYAHRVLRRISAFCGIDRDSLSEYLVPLHLAFIVYASTRGDFVLGGLQALFEHDLDKALDDIVDGEHRCPLDPGCAKHGSACVACLHVGEPSCRFFNGFLDRDVLFGASGYSVLG